MIQKLSDFEKVQCLCLDRRIDRVLQLEQQWAERGISVERFMTGEGGVLPLSEYSLIDPNPAASNTFKCYYNHREMLIKAKKDGIKNLVMLEDDCVLLDGFDSAFENAVAHLNSNNLHWDILYLGANHTWANTEEISPNLLKLHGGTYCLHAFAINNDRQIIDQLLKLPFRPDIGPLDLWIARDIQPNYDCYAVWPNLAIQGPGYSFLVQSEQDYSEYFRSKGKLINERY